MKIKLLIWRQNSLKEKGSMHEYDLEDVSPDMSFLEMLDQLNEKLLEKDEDPVSFDHDCREGICGTCGVMINGRAHGPLKGVTTCQLHMRSFKDGDILVVEPFRAKPFSVVRDLVVNRMAFDNIMKSGGYISVKTGGAPDANSIAILKDNADEAFDSAECIKSKKSWII